MSGMVKKMNLPSEVEILWCHVVQGNGAKWGYVWAMWIE
jgi:hypothetical protein